MSGTNRTTALEPDYCSSPKREDCLAVCLQRPHRPIIQMGHLQKARFRTQVGTPTATFRGLRGRAKFEEAPRSINTREECELREIHLSSSSHFLSSSSSSNISSRSSSSSSNYLMLLLKQGGVYRFHKLNNKFKQQPLLSIFKVP